MIARRLITHKQKMTELERDLRQAHISRLYKGHKESIDTSAIHLDVLTNQEDKPYITNAATLYWSRRRTERTKRHGFLQTAGFFMYTVQDPSGGQQ
jgi:hypothetical protein